MQFWNDDKTQVRGAVLTWIREQGYTPRHIPVPSVHGPRWALSPDDACSLDLLGHHPLDERFQVLLAQFASAPEEGLCRWQSRWAGRLWRSNRSFRGLLIGLAPDQLVATVPFPDGRVDRPGLRHVAVSPARRTPLDQERLARLALLPSDSDAETLTARLADDLDLRHVGNSFFRAFRTAHETLWEGTMGPGLDDVDRQTVALVTLNRLLFLYFVQRKGYLGGRQDFLRSQVEACRMRGGDLYHDLLRPLFFAYLNTPIEDRDTPAEERFGVGIPYLNGGLFEPCAVERACPDLTVAPEALDAVFVHVLERYSFTTSEDGVGAGVDPMMLGRVFESLMDTETRGSSGTFYTPRPLVDRMVREGLEELLGGWELSTDTIRALLDGDARGLDPLRAAQLSARVRDLTVLDPACGSGAFLLGAMHTLERVQTALWRVVNPGCPAPPMRRSIVRRNLHGIDRSAMAVHLCELRLWLAILDVDDTENIEPLPNLDHKIVQGDALLSPLDWCSLGGDYMELNAELREVTALVADYSGANARDKGAARARLYDAHTRLTTRLVERARARNRFARATLENVLTSKDLFGDPVPAPRVRREVEKLEAEGRRLDALVERAEEDGEAASFSACVQFASVMRDGGFHLIVGNPPWVRIHAVPPGTRAQLRRGFETLRDCAWTAGGLLASTKGFASQPDLSVCFVEQATRWLRRGGVFSMLLPSKLGRALYGAGIRRHLARTAPPRTILELGSDYFRGATTYPMGLIAAKGGGPAPVRIFTQLEGPGSLLPPEALHLVADDYGSPWMLSPSRTPLPSENAAPMASVERVALRRGFMTGCNDAFLLGPEETFPGHQIYALRGGDLGPFEFVVKDRMAWTHDLTSGRPKSALPAELAERLHPHEDRLRRRNGLRASDPFWRVFRTGPHLYGHKVAWRDIGPELQAVAVPPEVDGVPVVPLNTVYFVPVSTRQQALLLAGFLNSKPVRRWVDQVAERASGGYRRYFAWVLSLLPLPTRLAEVMQRPVAEADLDPAVATLLQLSRRAHEGHCDEPALAAAVTDLYAASPPAVLRTLPGVGA